MGRGERSGDAVHVVGRARERPAAVPGAGPVRRGGRRARGRAADDDQRRRLRVRRARRSAWRSTRCSTPIERRRHDRPVPAGASADVTPEPDWNFPFEEPLHDVFPALHDAQSAWMSQIDSLPRARPQDARAHPAGVHRDPAQPAGHPPPRAARRARSAPTWDEVLGSIMLTVPGVRDARRRSRRSRTRARRVRRRAQPPRGRLTDGRRRSASGDRRPVPDPAAAHRPATATSGPAARDGRAAVPALPGLRLLHPPADADLPDVPLEGPRSEAVSGRATLHTYSINHQPWMPGPELPVRGRDRRDPRAGRPAAHDEHRQLSRPTSRRSACRCGSRSSTPDDDDDVCIPLFEPASADVSIDPSSSSSGARSSAASASPTIGRRLLPRPARAHPRRVPRRDRGRRPHDRRTSTASPPTRARWRSPAGFSRRRAWSTCRTRCGSSSAGGTGGIERPGQLGSVINACLAVASGLANHVLCFRSVCEGSAQGDKGRAAVMPGGRRRRRLPGQRVHGVDAAVRGAVGRDRGSR